MQKIVQTRFLGPTTHQGARIEVKDFSRGVLRQYPYDYVLSGFEAHWECVSRYLEGRAVTLVSDTVRPGHDGYNLVLAVE